MEHLEILVSTAVDVLETPGEDVFCGVTLLLPRRAATVSSSNDVAQKMDEVQCRSDDGPRLTAAHEEREVYLDEARRLHTPVHESGP